MESKFWKSALEFLVYAIFLIGLISSCEGEEPIEEENNLPVVSNPISDLSLDAGFSSTTVDIGNVFDDEDRDPLTFSLENSNTSAVTATISGATITVTEVAPGNATIEVTANDGNGGTVSDSFIVSVNGAGNENPTVITLLSDMTFTEGFGTENIVVAQNFTDQETQMLMFSVSSSDEQVVTVSVDMATVTISEVGIGESTITVTAMDTDGGSVSDEFVVTVESGQSGGTCQNDNSTNFNRTTCDQTPSANTYSESLNGEIRMITTNGLPTHDYGNQIPDLVNELDGSTNNYELDATPSLAANTTNIVDEEFRPQVTFGLALNGVHIDPAPGEPFIFENTQTGEFNWDWVMEPNANMTAVGLDCATAHIQPDGAYHYHGDMIVYADQLLSGLGSGSTVPTEPMQIGWAADGFPIVYKYGYDDAGNFTELSPSYSLKAGDRPGDGVSEPCGEYNGKYTNDYEFVQGSGDLDECNGISRQIELGGEQFDYYYVITEDFPVISRCLSGTPASDLEKGGQGGGMP